MKTALYIHGAFSAYKPDSEKVKNLQKQFNVVGTSYSMNHTFEENSKMLAKFAKDNNVDFIVGTSLGGLYACELSNQLEIPAIMINPCVEPQMSLSTIIGTAKNYSTGLNETLTKETVETFPKLAEVTNRCLIFVGQKDDLIDSLKTKVMFEKTTEVILNPNEDHYWEFFEENKSILEFVTKQSKIQI